MAFRVSVARVNMACACLPLRHVTAARFLSAESDIQQRSG